MNVIVCKDGHRIQISIDLYKSANNLYNILKSNISQDSNLTFDNAALSTDISLIEKRDFVNEYFKFLCIKHVFKNDSLFPTDFVIILVYFSHMLRPNRYAYDCKCLFDDLIGNKLNDLETTRENQQQYNKLSILFDDIKERSSEKENNQIIKEYTINGPLVEVGNDIEQPLSNNNNNDNDDDSMYQKINESIDLYNKFKEDIYSRFEVLFDLIYYDAGFVSDLKQYGYQLEIKENLEREIELYEDLLNIDVRLNPQNAVPSPGCDLIWHTHQLHPIQYHKDTSFILGRVLDHIPYKDELNKVENNFPISSFDF